MRLMSAVGLGCLMAVGLATPGCDDTRLRVVTTHYDLFFPTGAVQVDTFDQKAAATIDILWVIDNSPSMVQEQQNLADNFSAFIQVLEDSNVDYQIGVISSDMDQATYQGKLQGNPLIIKKSDANPAAEFSANVKVGITGAGFERALEASYHALTPPLSASTNAGFLRDGAALAIIYVSDEDDHSFGKIAFYQRTFEQMKDIGNENRVVAGALVGDIPDGCDNGSTGKAQAGERYHDLIAVVGGSVGSICQTDFSATLSQLGLTVAGLTRKYTLSDPNADAATVTVKVDGATIPNDRDTGWILENGNIFFSGSYVPPPGSIIEVSFLHPQREFVLSQSPLYAADDPGKDLTVTVYPPEAADCSAQAPCAGGADCGLAAKCGGAVIPYSLENGWVLEEKMVGGVKQFIIAFERAYFPPGGSTVQAVYRCAGGCK